ncbi:hypothetical protein COO60DRAFT_672349 [Scenedesmus sp. NREL 46B-D3]|nr:hypothetical protein COO60DRAFT_672349 [Scenedesmus sp. NREL 46B-D3]
MLHSGSRVDQLGAGGIIGMMASLQKKLLPGDHPGSSSVVSKFRSALGGSLAGASLVTLSGHANVGGSSSSSSSSDRAGLSGGLLSSRAATTGLAARAQMLLTKDLAALTPRTQHLRDPALQQQRTPGVEASLQQPQPPQQQQQQQQWRVVPEVGTGGVACGGSVERQSGPAGADVGGSSTSNSAAGRTCCETSSSRPSSSACSSNMSLAAAGSGALARQLHSQGLAAAAEYQQARAAVDKIFGRMGNHQGSSKCLAGSAAAAAGGTLQSTVAPVTQGSVTVAAGAAAGLHKNSSCGEEAKQQQPPVLGRCASLKAYAAYSDFQATSRQLPGNNGVRSGMTTRPSISRSSSSSSKAVAGAGAYSGCIGGVPSAAAAAAAAARAAQQAGLQLTGSAAKQAGKGSA